nr:SDR family oxidoreductase [Azohydromonas aeria]
MGTDTNMQGSQEQGIAVITGASSGIGALYADRLARRGFDLVLVARNEGRLAEVARGIRERTGRAVQVLGADLTDAADLRRVEALLREDARITMLVNNAGFGAVAPLLDSDVDQMERMIDLNVTALTRLVYAAAPAFAARGRGTIVNIASIVAVGVEVLNGVYGASKAYVLALTQSLQHELGARGVRVQAVLPGATATEFWDLAGLPHSHLPADWVMPADRMVDAALAGLDLGEVVTIPPLQDGDAWSAYDFARRGLSEQFRHAVPAPRYGV